MNEQVGAGGLDSCTHHVSTTRNEPSGFFDLSDDTPTTMLGDDSFLTSLESGGAMLNLGHWGTTERGMEWSDPWGLSGGGKPALVTAGVNEGVFDSWVTSGVQKPATKSGMDAGTAAIRRSLSSVQTKSRHMPSGFFGIVKADPEGGWVSETAAAAAAGFAGVNSPSVESSVPAGTGPGESVPWHAEERTGGDGGLVKTEPSLGMSFVGAIVIFLVSHTRSRIRSSDVLCLDNGANAVSEPNQRQTTKRNDRYVLNYTTTLNAIPGGKKYKKRRFQWYFLGRSSLPGCHVQVAKHLLSVVVRHSSPEQPAASTRGVKTSFSPSERFL